MGTDPCIKQTAKRNTEAAQMKCSILVFYEQEKREKKFGAFDNISDVSFQAVTASQSVQLHNPETAKQERCHRRSAVHTPVSAAERLSALAALLQLAQDAKQPELAFGAAGGALF